MSYPKDLKPIATLGGSKPHGTRLRYMAGCKCMRCRAANSAYEVERSAARRRGEWNGFVPANVARKHIRHLSKHGIGRRAISEASDVCTSTIQKIKTGAKKNIRAATEKRILSVTLEAAADGASVPSAATWSKINWLLSEGFTKTELAQRLGYKKQLQIGRVKCLASTAMKVEKFYNKIRLGDEDEFYPDDMRSFLTLREEILVEQES